MDEGRQVFLEGWRDKRVDAWQSRGGKESVAYYQGRKKNKLGHCMPVSYTHLDVYKRQTMHRSKYAGHIK